MAFLRSLRESSSARDVERADLHDATLDRHSVSGVAAAVIPTAPAAVDEVHGALKARLHIRLVDELLAAGDPSQWESLADGALALEPVVLTRMEREQILRELLAEMKGYGPIDHLLRDPAINEVMVNAPDQVYIEVAGQLRKTDVRFKDDAHVLRIIEKIVSPIGRRIDESSPFVDARLPDGSRVHAIIPPLALRGPCLTIRKFAATPLQVDDLIQYGTLTPAMANFLRAAIAARLNIVISGGTGSGKTTTLGVVSSFIDERERIVTIEDAAELRLQQAHWVALESRPPNAEGKGAVSIRELVRNSLRMRPDRIVVGEVRGAETLDMLQAMNTGHDGSLTTAHANTPRDMLRRLETMVMMAGMDLPSRAIREQIASAVQLIVQQSRLSDGTRRITHITEVVGMEGEQITLQDVFSFVQTGRTADGSVQGFHTATGTVPHCLELLRSRGQPISLQWFQAITPPLREGSA